jgi:hypothetical protein
MKKFDRVKILNGKRKGELGYLLTFIETECYEMVAVEFEDEAVETYAPNNVEIISSQYDQRSDDMTFTEWYKETCDDEWTDEHAPLVSLLYDYEDWCEENKIAPIFNG